MKKPLILFTICIALAFIYSGCNSSKQGSGMHHRGVNNSHYIGY